MAGIARIEKIDDWELSRELTNKVYALTRKEVFSSYDWLDYAKGAWPAQTPQPGTVGKNGCQ